MITSHSIPGTLYWGLIGSLSLGHWYRGRWQEGQQSWIVRKPIVIMFYGININIPFFFPGYTIFSCYQGTLGSQIISFQTILEYGYTHFFLQFVLFRFRVSVNQCKFFFFSMQSIISIISIIRQLTGQDKLGERQNR